MKTRHGNAGISTIEMVVVISLFGVVLLSLAGLHLVALSAGTAAETSSVAANLARARMEELLALPPEKIKEQNHAEASRQVPAQGGRVYTVRTTVEAPDPTRLDLTVTVSWQVTYAGACSAAPGTNCPGTAVTSSRTLQTRVHTFPAQP